VDWICTVCDKRQEYSSKCSGCGDDGLLDLRKQDTRLFLVDVDQRRRVARESQLRMISVVIGMVVVIAMWFIPGFWAARARYFALPLLFDQIALMTAIAFGMLKLLPLRFGVRPRFPFVDGAGDLRPAE
jgi:hypothetical protein